MEVIFNKEEDAYICREQVDNQTIELGMNCTYWTHDEKSSWWNIYITIYNKKKDMYDNMDKHIITGKNPFKTFAKAREMFYAVEAQVLEAELLLQPKTEKIIIYCTWVDNRRRDAYYKVLSKMGYTWGRTPIMKQKCIMKVYKREDLHKEIEL